jgi:hypothetical protein
LERVRIANVDLSEPGMVQAWREADAEWIREQCPETRQRGVDGNGVSAVIWSLVSVSAWSVARTV